jgi:hypothetical protein
MLAVMTRRNWSSLNDNAGLETGRAGAGLADRKLGGTIRRNIGRCYHGSAA